MPAPLRTSAREPLEIVEELVEPPGAPVGGDAAERRHRPVPPAPEALQDLAPHRAARAPGGHREIRAGERVRGRAEREPNVRERGARARAFEHVARRSARSPGSRPARRATARRGARRATRVSTAMSLGFAPRARHSTICATAAAANSSGAPRAVVRAGAPEGFAATDRLRDAHPVVGEQVRRGADDVGRAAVVHLELQMRGTREVAVVVDEERRIRAGIAVDDLIVVTDAEHVVGRRRDEAQHQELRGREVLELVDEEVPAFGLQLAPDVDVREQHFERAVDLFVVVHHRVVVQTGAIAGEHRREPFDVVAPGLDALGWDQAEPHLAERFEVRARACRCSGAAGPGRAVRSGAARPTRSRRRGCRVPAAPRRSRVRAACGSCGARPARHR